MCRICPKCGSIAEYSDYYGTVVCTRCSWESEKISYNESQKYSSYREIDDEQASLLKKEKELVKV